MKITEDEKKVLWQVLYSVRNCFNDDGTLIQDYYVNVILPDLTKEQMAIFNDLTFKKLLR
jgi:hypothetical protein